MESLCPLAVSKSGIKNLNFYKTKYMSNRSTESLKFDSVEIEKVVEYTYLGRIISFEEGLLKKYWKGKGGHGRDIGL